MSDAMSLDYVTPDVEVKTKLEEFLQSFVIVRTFQGKGSDAIQVEWKQTMSTLDGYKATDSYDATLSKWSANEKLRALIISNRVKLQYTPTGIQSVLDKKLT